MPKYLFVPAANSGNDLTGAIMQDDGALPHTQALADGTYDAYFCEAAASTLTMNDTSGGGNVAPSNTAAPAVTPTGTQTTGTTLTSTTGAWTGTPTPTYAYQWRRGASDISGATSATYDLAVADEGQSITCRVTATNSEGSATADSNAVTGAAASGGRIIIPGGASGAHLRGAIVPDVASFSETYDLRFTTMPTSDLYLQNHDVVGLWMGATQFTSYSDDFGFQGGSAHGMTTGTDYDLVVTIDQGTGLSVTVGGSAVHTNGGATPGATLGAGTLTIFGNGDAPAGQRLACEVSSLSIDNGGTNYLDLDGTPADWNGSTYIVDGPVVAA